MAAMAEQAAVEHIARAVVAARRARAGCADYPGPTPATLDEGYAIQERAIALFDKPIAGWKVGRVPGPLIARHGGVDRLSGPIFADSIGWGKAG